MKLSIKENENGIMWNGIYEDRAFIISYVGHGSYDLYVDVTNTSSAGTNYEKIELSCRGEFPYYEDCFIDGEFRQCISWYFGSDEGRQYKIIDIINECITVIDQINAKEAK